MLPLKHAVRIGLCRLCVCQVFVCMSDSGQIEFELYVRLTVMKCVKSEFTVKFVKVQKKSDLCDLLFKLVINWRFSMMLALVSAIQRVILYLNYNDPLNLLILSSLTTSRIYIELSKLPLDSRSRVGNKSQVRDCNYLELNL